MRGVFRTVALLLVAASCLSALACGPERLPTTGATLEGTINYGNQKVPYALVVVAGQSSSAQGFVRDDGKFKIDNVPLGDVSIGVNTAAGKGELTGRIMAMTQGGKGAKPALPKAVDVPQKYFDPAQSGIKTTVSKGSNTFDIVLPK